MWGFFSLEAPLRLLKKTMPSRQRGADSIRKIILKKYNVK